MGFVDEEEAELTTSLEDGGLMKDTEFVGSELDRLSFSASSLSSSSWTILRKLLGIEPVLAVTRTTGSVAGVSFIREVALFD